MQAARSSTQGPPRCPFSGGGKPGLAYNEQLLLPAPLSEAAGSLRSLAAIIVERCS
jgi:hypothetical protein